MSNKIKIILNDLKEAKYRILNIISKNKKPIITIASIWILISTIGLFQCGTQNGDNIEKLKKIETEYNSLKNKCDSLQTDLNNKTSDFNKLQEDTKEYMSLNEQEKSIVDQAIVDAKKSTEEELAKQKAEEEAKKKAEEEKKAQEEAERKAQEQAQKEAEEQAKREAEAHKYETGLTWEDIARDNHTGELCQFSGKIIQVMYGTVSNQYRVAIDDDYDRIMLIDISKDQITSNILENDYISFRGMSAGNYTYTTVMGGKVTIPFVYVDDFQRQ